jgi:hypothetical protein
MSEVRLQLCADFGGANNIGFERTDSPMMHVIVRAKPGEPIRVAVVSEHIATCQVCRAHGITYEDFEAFMTERGQAKPFATEAEATAYGKAEAAAYDRTSKKGPKA